ncbi:transposase [Candidatus Kuenenbacteria bacterium]|nr:transposase [Candidatus Kuenenbacteria bacterium]
MEFYNHIHCKYTGVKGFLRLHNYALKWAYMITKKAKCKIKVLSFWEKHGLEATLDAFPVKRSTFFLWKKKLKESSGKLEALNEERRTPRTKRKRIWPCKIRDKIKNLREEHPNLGPEKLYPLLLVFCNENNLICPKPRTVARIIADDPEKMRIFPKKISHFGKVRPLKRQRVLRKPKDLKALYPGHLVALDTIEKFINGTKRYIITFEDIHTRFSFAWATISHASLAAKEFFNLCLKVFPYSFNFLYVLTDNGSEFKKHFAEELKRLHLLHFHTYPKTPKMNAHVERFNRTIQEEFVDYHLDELMEPDTFNNLLIDYLIFYNTERVHCAFKNKLSPMQFMLQWQEKALLKLKLSNLTLNQPINISIKTPMESNFGWHYTEGCKFHYFLLIYFY